MAHKIPVVHLKPGEEKEITLEGTSGQFYIIGEQSSLMGGQRTDMGAPFDMSKPQGYRERVATMWLAYDYDSGFKYLIDRLAHFGINGFSFFSEEPDELDFWNQWEERLNEGIPTILPGLSEVMKWNMKHLPLGAAAYNNWQWGNMRIGKRNYEVPVKWTLHNQQSIVISRKGSGFSDYKAGVYVANDSLSEGDTSWAKGYNVENVTNLTTRGNSGDKILYPKDPTSYFLLRFNSTPADNTREDQKPQSEGVGASFSLYPTPPFFPVLNTIRQRQQLRSMDLNIVDGFINKLVIWKIGNKEFPPQAEVKDKAGNVTKESTIVTVKNVITKETKSNTLQLFLPFWVEVDIKTPDINPLLSSEKYIQPWLDMMQAFGIIVNPKSSGAGEFKEVNTQNFEQLVEFYRSEHIKKMLEHVVFREIAKRNNLTVPEIRFNPLNTVSNEFLQNMRELMAMGRLSSDTLLKYHKQDKKFELPLIKQELDETAEKKEWAGWSQVEIFNTNTPIRFKQQVVNAAGSEQQPDLGKGGQAKSTGIKKPPAGQAATHQDVPTQSSAEVPGRPAQGKIAKNQSRPKPTVKKE